MAKNNILMLHGSSDLYGASKIFLVTAQLLKEEGHGVTVILSEDGPLVGALKDLGIHVKLLRLGIIRRKYFNLKGLLNRAKVMRNAIKTLKKLATEEGITHIYSNTAAVWVGAFVAKGLNLRHIWHLHEIILKPSWFGWAMGKMINRFAHKVIVVSEAVQNHWSRFVSEEKLALIYNGINYKPYLCGHDHLRKTMGIPAEALVIGMIGRVNSWKGQEYFLEISEELNKKFLNLYFILVGDPYPGDERLYEGLELNILKKKFNHKIYNLGFRSDIPRVLATMDIFILPSILPDPFPTVVLEAMASQKPIVATAHGGALEMISDGVTGVHIPWNAPEEAARKMEPLVEDENFRLKMGIKAKESVLNNFSLPSFREKILTVFSEEVN
ncbi:MAG: glycosyltransferase family 4 protein [Cyclobacteriaceae bacterium]